MRRALLAALGLVAGLATGGLAATVAAPARPLEIVSIPTPAPATTLTRALPPPPANRLYLLWTPGSLPSDLAKKVGGISGVEAVAEVLSDLIYLAGEDGFVIPVEVFAIDAAGYPRLLPSSALAVEDGLAGGRVVLGETSAALRRVEVGGTLELATGGTLTVGGIVADVLVGGAEVVVDHTTGRQLGVTTPRFLLVEYQGERAALEAAVRTLLPADLPVRVRALGETPFLRHGDAVLPQVMIKHHFGEFSLKPGEGTGFTPDPIWVERWIVIEELPLVGRTQCHRSFLPLLLGALQELERAGLSHLVDPTGFRGCWNPRFIAPGRGLSRHAWGVAVDLNYSDNKTGVASTQDPRLVEVMRRWGLTWGGNWLVPDPAHFEYTG